MPSITEMLHPRCQKHPAFEQEDCLICTKETPQERDARMAEFHKRFPALGLAAVRETGRFVREDVDHDARESAPVYWEPRDE